MNVNRWAACGLWIAFVWVPFTILRVRSARRAVILGKRPRRLFYNRRTPSLNRSFLYRPVLIRGVQSGAAQHRHATDVLCRSDFTIR